MIVNLRFDFSDDKLQAIGLLINGKRKPPTRRQIVEWAGNLVFNEISPNGGDTKLRSYVCPKCNKPISIPVPVAKAEKADAPNLVKVKSRAHSAADALTLLVEALREVCA